MGGSTVYLDRIGAAGDGLTLDTGYIRAAHVMAGNGGRVVYGPKQYLSDAVDNHFAGQFHDFRSGGKIKARRGLNANLLSFDGPDIRIEGEGQGGFDGNKDYQTAGIGLVMLGPRPWLKGVRVNNAHASGIAIYTCVDAMAEDCIVEDTGVVPDESGNVGAFYIYGAQRLKLIRPQGYNIKGQGVACGAGGMARDIFIDTPRFGHLTNIGIAGGTTNDDIRVKDGYIHDCLSNAYDSGNSTNILYESCGAERVSGGFINDSKDKPDNYCSVTAIACWVKDTTGLVPGTGMGFGLVGGATLKRCSATGCVGDGFLAASGWVAGVETADFDWEDLRSWNNKGSAYSFVVAAGEALRRIAMRRSMGWDDRPVKLQAYGARFWAGAAGVIDGVTFTGNDFAGNLTAPYILQAGPGAAPLNLVGLP